ncbi:MAG: T9SS type A sorting domain-containing protein [Candidatus Marinimicrobia bacterium]|nr:T9SS type A sorting domain-containing protein [Candidatus Neomarinimicrobiota bacterium]
MVNSEDLDRIANGEVNTQPISFELQQAYPNPFNPITAISFEIANKSLVEISIIDLKGQVVTKLISEEKLPGHYSTKWDAKDISSGTYLIHMKTPNFSASQKINLVK